MIACETAAAGYLLLTFSLSLSLTSAVQQAIFMTENVACYRRTLAIRRYGRRNKIGRKSVLGKQIKIAPKITNKVTDIQILALQLVGNVNRLQCD